MTGVAPVEESAASATGGVSAASVNTEAPPADETAASAPVGARLHPLGPRHRLLRSLQRQQLMEH